MPVFTLENLFALSLCRVESRRLSRTNILHPLELPSFVVFSLGSAITIQVRLKIAVVGARSTILEIFEHIVGVDRSLDPPRTIDSSIATFPTRHSDP